MLYREKSQEKIQRPATSIHLFPGQIKKKKKSRLSQLLLTETRLCLSIYEGKVRLGVEIDLGKLDYPKGKMTRIGCLIITRCAN